MSTGKRLAKRSIIGTRVCAPGEDGKYYSGVIHAVKTPASAASESGLSITPKTRYSVRFDSVPGGRPPSPSTEYSDRDLIGPGFGSVTSARLVPGQKVYLTYNGREIHAEVTQHREHLDEVDVIIAPTGQEDSAVAFKPTLNPRSKHFLVLDPYLNLCNHFEIVPRTYRFLERGITDLTKKIGTEKRAAV
ncbi:hypothetical protein K0M31_011425 [Melipona bicolor]|uniref:DUF4772 domain-containing protein n=1 Tax=Melipona bicolor TaxID=60889 RepID=A0AA40KV14_9HYME|nr:hypothetical protein K0M31_011425 [Melipona bicolor]